MGTHLLRRTLYTPPHIKVELALFMRCTYVDLYIITRVKKEDRIRPVDEL